jgi:23S rRNA (adenine2503-C2)-methyltransferase
MAQLIYDFDLPTIATLLQGWGEPAYRAKQIWQGLYQHLYSSPEQFTNIPIPLRAKLAEYFTFTPFTVKTWLDSSDKSTRKTLFQLPDGNLIEAVLMRYGDPADRFDFAGAPLSAKKRRTLCISTQAGCAMGCVFCATGQMGFKRHLSSGEIVAQVLYYARMLKAEEQTVTNIVLMGMGEPFHNYDNTMAAIDRLNDPADTTSARAASPSRPWGWRRRSGVLPTRSDRSTWRSPCMPRTMMSACRLCLLQKDIRLKKSGCLQILR